MRYNRAAEKQTWTRFEELESIRLACDLEEERFQAELREYEEDYSWDHYDDRYDDYRGEVLEKQDQIDDAWSTYDEFLRPPGAWGVSGVPYNVEDVFVDAMNRAS